MNDTQRTGWIAVTSLVLLVGCSGSTPEPIAAEQDADLVPWQTLDGKGDLPNDSVYHREHDRKGYREIAQRFIDEGYDVSVDVEALEAIWPMDDEHTTVLNRSGTPILFSYMGYLHSAFDIYRSDIRGNDEILAPVSGVARVFDWNGVERYTRRPYETVVAIWDPESHLIIQLMHVEPTEELAAAGYTEVRAGEVVGRLAADLTWLEGDDLERYRHTHVNVIDADNMVALNPATHLPYEDTVAPKLFGAYLLDDLATAHRDLDSGAFDVVLEAADRDDADTTNLEVAAIAFEITDDTGQVLHAAEKCVINDMIDSLDLENIDANDPSTMFIDYGSANWQTNYGNWGQTDFDYPNRTFRYALTQLTVDENGRCATLPDEEGFVNVADEVEAVHVRAQLFDHHGNVTEVDEVFRRDTTLDAGRLVINEVLPDPPEEHDANGDGVFDARQDEFVELVNMTEEAIRLDGYTLADDTGVRFTFPVDSIIRPSGAAVIFGGGEPLIRTRALIFVASLGLNNDGDKLTLQAADGTVVDTMAYRPDDLVGGSLTRAVDGDHHARFVEDPEGGSTPGTTVNRELF